MKLCLCLHDHQPVGNFQHVMESAYSRCYAPMMELLERHEGLRTGLHISGTLLEWLEGNHPEFLERCAALCGEGRMELLTGGRYEPILTIFRRNDISQQIRDFSRHLSGISTTPPRGLWLTERVWEPGLASLLAEAGVEWAVVDDIHLRRAGASAEDLHGPCITEDAGRTLKLLASDKTMRYMIPFSPVEQVIDQLRKYRDEGAELVFYGDDGEKFGVWPGTHDLCFGSGWLDSFFSAIESEDWLETVLPSGAAALPAAGPFYVPACSYSEMGEWTVHGSDRRDYAGAMKVLREAGMEDSSERLLTGGFWRNFLSFYPESKELHGRILSSEDMVRASGSETALHHFWRSQCNCAFWHGVFGGIYLPHLREAVWKEINLAEQAALSRTGSFPAVRVVDIDADGLMETLIITKSMSLTVHPGRGLTVSQLTFVGENGDPVPMGDVLSRRRESYHSEIPDESGADGVRTIHHSMGSKETGLCDKVMTDLWRRICFTQLVLADGEGPDEWSRCADSISAGTRSTSCSGPEIGEGLVEFACDFRSTGLSFRKTLRIDLERARISTGTEFRTSGPARVGTEVCLNLMTGDSSDRFFRVDGGPEMMMSVSGRFTGRTVEVVDGFRGAKVRMETGEPADIWTTPIESVNRSESGFERVHQGTAFLFSRTAGKGNTLMELDLVMEPLKGGPDASG